MQVTYHPEAETELIVAARFYEERVTGLGAQFLDGVDAAIEIITESPEAHRPVEVDFRSHLMRRFPFVIYFRIHPEEIRILAVKHHSRHPDYWRYRMS